VLAGWWAWVWQGGAVVGCLVEVVVMRGVGIEQLQNMQRLGVTHDGLWNLFEKGEERACKAGRMWYI